jgi:hypothetical protein
MTVAPAPAAAPGGTSASPDARALWRGGRGLLLALAVLLLAGGIIAFLSSGESGRLHPRSPAPHGSMALAELLDGQGVRISTVTTSAEAAAAVGPDTTLLITRPEAVAPARLTALHRAVTDAGGRLVLIAPTDRALEATVPGIAVIGGAESAELAPACAEPAARRAGTATLGGYLYHTAISTDAAGCYPVDGFPSLAMLDQGDAETVLLGSSALLTNEHLADHGNASLALQLLGSRENVAWYLPSAAETPPAEDEQSLLDLADDGWRWAALQLVIAAALTALWRMRRLGPVVTERLPVRIRAAETTEGRARLYHRAGARDRAAQALRAGTRSRLGPLVGIRQAHAEAALTAAVASRTTREPAEVHQLLHGPTPADDTGLVHLAGELDTLERQLGPAAARPPAPDSPHDPPTKDSSP